MRLPTIGSRAAIVSALLCAPAFGDGTEQLGPVAGLAKAHAVAAGGVGIALGQPASIQLELPEDAIVRQVLLYWEGLDWQATDHGPTSTALVGGYSALGDRIGGPTDLFGATFSSTYRADITGLGLVGPGANSVPVGGIDFTRFQQGAGLVALYDLPGATTAVQLVDGDDVANHLLAGALGTTAPVTFAVPASDLPQEVEVNLFFAPFANGQASVLVFESKGVQLDLLLDVITHSDGPSWCTVRHSLTVPAGTTELTVRALPVDSLAGPAKWMGEAKFVWMMASLTTPGAGEEEQGGLSACWWATNKKAWDGKGEDLTDDVQAGDSFNGSFGVSFWKSGLTSWVDLHEATKIGVGGLLGLNREAAAALANADAGIGYPFSRDEVIELYRDTVHCANGALGVTELRKLFAEANAIGYDFEGKWESACAKPKKGKCNDKKKCGGKGVKLLKKLLAKKCGK